MRYTFLIFFFHFFIFFVGTGYNCNTNFSVFSKWAGFVSNDEVCFLCAVFVGQMGLRIGVV
jgi:hypothetical protein